jgi:hypothetical protein
MSCAECNQPAHARGLCHAHYERHRRAGKLPATAYPMDARANEGNPAWKGDEASYSAIHKWLSRHCEKEGVCEECGREGRTEWAFLRWPKPVTRLREDYRELCRRCHQDFDASTGERNFDHLRRRRRREAATR